MGRFQALCFDVLWIGESKNALGDWRREAGLAVRRGIQQQNYREKPN
jgi:hypothetical protein